MKKMRLLVMAGLMVFGLSFTSFAGYDANVGYIARLQKSLEDTQREYEETSQEIEDMESQLENMESYYNKMTELYEKEMAKTGVKDMNFIVQYQELDNEYTNLENNLKATKKVNERCLTKIDSIKEQLSSATDKAVAWTGTMSEEDENDEVGKLTYRFSLEKKDGNWYLYSAYRAWTDMMGGQWEYSSIVNDDLDIAMYDSNDDCIDNNLNRAESMDTKTEYYWSVDADLTHNNKYYIEFNGNKYAVYAKDYENNTGNSHSADMHYGETEYVGHSDYKNYVNINEDSTTVYTDSTNGYYDSFHVMNYNINDLSSVEDNNGKWYQDENNRWHYTKSNGVDACHEYIKVNGRWYTIDVNGIMFENCWLVTPSGVKYYCDEFGAMAIGWRLIADKWYYFNADNSLFTNGVTPDGYTVSAEGILIG